MMPKQKQHIVNLAGVLGSLGVSIYAATFTGIGQIVTAGVAVNLLTDAIKKLWLGIMGHVETLRTNQGPLRDDLQKLLGEAILKATRHIGVIYQKRYPGSPLEKKSAARLVVALDEYFEKEHWDLVQTINPRDYLYVDEHIAEAQLLHSLEAVLQRAALPPSFIDCFKENIIPQLRLCFSEALKKEENRPAWIVFSKITMEETRAVAEKILKEQGEIKGQLETIFREQAGGKVMRLSARKVLALQGLVEELKNPARLQVRFDEALDKQLKGLQQELMRLAHLVEDTNEQVVRLRRAVDRTGAQSRRHKIAFVWATFVVVLSLTAGFYFYDNARPFGLTVALRWKPPMERIVSPEVFKRSGSFTLLLDGKTETASLNENGEAFFSRIPAHYRNDSVRILLNGLQGEPYQRVCDTCFYKLKPDGSIYIDIKPDGLDRVAGFTEDGAHKRLPHVTITTEELTTQSDANGDFLISIPPEKQKRRLNFIFTRPGHPPYYQNEIPVFHQSTPWAVTLSD